MQTKQRILRPLVEGLAIDAVDGQEILANASDLFGDNIDSDFTNYGADEPGQATKIASTNIYEMKEDATFEQMFGELSPDTEKLCLTQAQIKQFIRQHRNWLRADGWATFFPFKSNGKFFVARVRVRSGGDLSVFVRRFEHSNVWDAEDRHRVVSLQLA